MNHSRISKLRFWVLAAFVILSTYQVYARLESMFDLVASGAGGNFGWVWLLSGPILFFFSASTGTIFGYIAQATRRGVVKNLWILLVWLIISVLAGGALLFSWADWFGTTFGFTIGEHAAHFFTIVLPMIAVAYGLWTLVRDIRKQVSGASENSVLMRDSVASSLWKQAMLSAGRWAGALIAAVGSVAAVLVSGLLLFLWGCEPPSVQTLANRFPSERKDLETIIAMSDEDFQMAVIDPSWLQLQGQDLPNVNSAVGISSARWDEYRRIFRRNGITQGIRRYAPRGDTFLIVKSVGILDSGYSNGYLYCVPGIEHRYAPCSSTGQRGEQPSTGGVESYQFIKLTDQWYAFREGPI
jgi:hypothetical protein